MLDQLYLWVGIGGTIFVVASLISGGGNSDLESSGGDMDTSGLGEVSDGSDLSIGFFPSNLLSLRTATFFCTFFGWSGFIGLRLLGIPSLLSLALAIPTGLICAFIAAKTMDLLRRGEVSTDYSTNDLVGKEVDVTLPITAELPGQIRCYVKGSTVEYKALPLLGNEKFERQERVLIVEVEDGVVKVTKV